MERQPLQDSPTLSLANLNRVISTHRPIIQSSSILEEVSSVVNHMPIGGVGLMQDDDIEIVRQWIADGTLVIIQNLHLMSITLFIKPPSDKEFITQIICYTLHQRH